MPPSDPARRRVAILATGGTIAGHANTPLDRAYRASGADAAALIAAVPHISAIADVRGETVAEIGSQDMTLATWRVLEARIATLFAQDTDAIVIAHGTDTLEETAFVLDLVTAPGRPVVLVGAMRPGNVPSADGPGNLLEAVRVAADDSARGRGVLIVLNSNVHRARHVRKTQTSGVDAFRSFPGGPIGAVSPAAVQFFLGASTSPLQGSLILPAKGALPPIPILFAHADMDAVSVEALLSTGAAGMVLAGLGNGNASAPVLKALGDAVQRGVAVVRATRVGDGFVDRNIEVDDDGLGFIAARDLSPQKSRLLLQLMLANGITGKGRLQRAFDDRPRN